MSSTEHKFTNDLFHESSPYLLQHAHNPVNWFAWNEATLQKAKDENKMMLVSVGYSACHWCHVMEHESFEDVTVARMMNDLFVCVKVDREERPDIDQVYMAAVQLMTGRGGWPLNCFTLPDGRPLYGGTYFPKEKWKEVLLNLADLWKTDPEKCFQYAGELTEGVKQTEQIVMEDNGEEIVAETLGLSVEQWKTRFDTGEGGPNRAPKFPLPNNYQLLLRYAHFYKDPQVQKHVYLTLDKMAMGGIYDQVGGGFARYSTDMLWKVPHFEKMLYDNAQLISLYSEAYLASGKQLYKDVVYQSLKFISRELTASNGAFYSALDADSEGEEGKFYVWTENELKENLGEMYPVVADYYSVNSIGHWEHGNYILLRRDTEEIIAVRHQLTVEALLEIISKANEVLLSAREKRIRPGLDDKTLTSWNAMMLKGYADAYQVFGEEEFLLAALKNARFIRDVQLRKDGGLWHSWKNGKSTINGFLEDYAFAIDAFISLYQVTFDEQWLDISSKLCDYVFTHFNDETSGMFFFTSDEDPALIARKMELADNVIPSSNSVMARNLFYLGHFMGKPDWTERSAKMLRQLKQEMIGYGGGHSNWMMLQLHVVFPFREVVIVGKTVDKTMEVFRKSYLPNQIFAGSPGPSELPLLQNRFIDGKTLIYVCENNTCQLPMEDAAEVVRRLSEAT
ncbi:MAG: thioredoxin domain-containing protein [Bacteroidota bacterium]|nr:thioredoxin domain-containing protein [Bacteroidota bacterium]